MDYYNFFWIIYKNESNSVKETEKQYSIEYTIIIKNKKEKLREKARNKSIEIYLRKERI